MAVNWNLDPDWASIELINKGFTIEFGDGFVATDQVKIVENLQYLFNHITAQHVFVGNISTITGESGTLASVRVTSRAVVDVGTYLDFEFTIPKGIPAGFGTPEASATWLPTGSQPSVSVTASGDSTAKVFNFKFKIPEGPEGPEGPVGDIGPPGPPGPSVAAGMSIITVSESDWVNNKLIIPANIHNRGETSALLVVTKPEVTSSVYGITYDSSTVDDNGTITITTRKKWRGLILIAGGFTAVTDVETRALVLELRDDFEALEVVVSTI